MYSFEPTGEQKMLVEAVSRFAAKDLREIAHDADAAAELPRATIERGWELGVLQSSIPEQYGGFGERSAVTNALAAEALAYGDLAGALAIMAPALFGLPILSAGSDAQRQAFLPRLVQAGYPATTAALVEPRYDFDPNALATRAREDGDGYVLDGEKCYVPLAAEAEHLLVFARLDGATQGFVVKAGTPGLAITEREQNMGLRALPTYGLRLSGCRVACADRLGGAGGHEFAPILNASRTALSALAVGLAHAAYDYALAYAKERTAFGEPIAQRQSIAFMLAEMITDVEAARLLVWEAAWLLDQGRDATRAAYLAHIATSDVALAVADQAVQILGGHGYIRDHPVELWLRNARGFPVFEGLAMV
jgi:alkylation response protein AidB-like acyl-CoA dehydrogenase